MSPAPYSHWHQKLLAAQLYGIVDLGYVQPEGVEEATRQLCSGGVDVLQLRAKGCTLGEIESMARKIHTITQAQGVPLVINDHLELAASVGSEGVHIGQDDQSVAVAREVVGPDCIVGKSTHSLDQAQAAQAEGADYIGFGPLYATGTKPTYTPIGLDDLAEVHRRVTLPIFCIGGVNPARLDEILQAGAQRVVIVSAFLQAADIAATVRAVKERLRPLDLL